MVAAAACDFRHSSFLSPSSDDDHDHKRDQEEIEDNLCDSVSIRG